MTKSQSRKIPISPRMVPSHGEEEDMDTYQRDAILADFKDYALYSRIVTGMRRNQCHTRHHDLRYQNEAVIDHIIYTRHNLISQQSPPHSPTTTSRSSIVRGAASAGLSPQSRTEDMMMLNQKRTHRHANWLSSTMPGGNGMFPAEFGTSEYDDYRQDDMIFEMDL